MDSTTVRKLFHNLDQAGTDEAIDVVTTARTDPDAARTLWELILSSHATDEHIRVVLEWVLESVLVDQITNHMSRNDEYALIIGRRLSTLLERIARLQPEQQAKAA